MMAQLTFATYAAIVVCVTAVSSSSQRPHIILIVADDLGYNDVSFHGSNQIPTPNLDGLAYSGIILNNYYVSPICTPTRSALMTGRHPIHTGMQSGVILGATPYGLSLKEKLLPQHLNDLGYHSHMVGKRHLGDFKWEYTPIYRGFKSHFGYYLGKNDYFNHTYEDGKSKELGLDFRKNKDLKWNYNGQYSTNLFADEAVSIIQDHDKNKPLFLYLPFQSVHSANPDGQPLQAPQNIIDKFSYIENHDRRTYAAMVSCLDDAVGQIYSALNKTGMADNSIIVFTTDNGGPANGFNDNAASNFPLRGVKETLWEGGVRGAGFIHSPLLQTKGYTSDRMLHVCDWMPTLYHAAGGDTSVLKDLDGSSAWNMLSKNGSDIRTEILHNIEPLKKNAAIRVGDFKLLIGHVNMKWDGWYPPYQLEGDEVALHVENYSHNYSEPLSKQLHRKSLEEKYKSYWSSEVFSKLKQYQEASDLTNTVISKSKGVELFSSINSELDASSSSSGIESMDNGLSLNFRSSEALRRSTGWSGTPVRVDCGPKPANASTNCNPNKYPCLFNIRLDPCEYNNLVMSLPQKATELLNRLAQYAETMVEPRNKPVDPKGYPSHHDGAWVPWR